TLAPRRLRAPERTRPSHPFTLLFERQLFLGFVPGHPFRVELPVLRWPLDRHIVEQLHQEEALLADPLASAVPAIDELDGLRPKIADDLDFRVTRFFDHLAQRAFLDGLEPLDVALGQPDLVARRA